ncbi:MAG: sulfurase [Ruegeria sp.]
MPVLRESGYAGEVVWLGHVAAGGSLRATPVERLSLGFAGAPGERHEGTNRASCVRVRNLYPEGTEIRNVRQLSILSHEELTEIAAGMELEELDPALVGANVVVRGIPDFTHLPPASRLRGPSGVTLTIDMENRPCVLPGREVEEESPGHGAAFKPSATDRRGVTAWVERPGGLAIGDRMELFVPDQRPWAP